MAAITDLLRPWLTVEPDQAEQFAGYVSGWHAAKQEVLFAAGSPVESLMLIAEGVARACYIHGHREVNLRLICGPAALLPYRSYLAAEPADETLIAVTDLRGYRVRFRDYCRDYPGVLAETLKRILAEQHFLALDRRLRMLQSRTAAERYAFYCQHMEPQVIAATPDFQVASYLGMTPESLSRIKAQQART